MKYTQTVILIFCTTLLFCQKYSSNEVEFWSGGGPMASKGIINGIYPMLINENIFEHTPHNDREVDALGGTFWMRTGVPETNLFFEGSFSFLSNLRKAKALDGGHFNLTNERGLEYSVLFDYDQIGLGASVGYFVLFPNHETIGLYLTPISFSWSILAGKGVKYISTEPQFDLAVQESLRQGLKFKNDLQYSPGIGLQFKLADDIAIEARYNYVLGLADIIETQDNPYFWRPVPDNTTMSHQVSIVFLKEYNND